MVNTPLMKKVAVNNGANAQLFCKSRGSPLPHFTWVFNGKIILPNVTDYKYGFTYTNVRNDMTLYNLIRTVRFKNGQIFLRIGSS
jgi:hypothetical protein